MPRVSPDTSVQVLTDKAADLTAKKAGNLALAKIDLFTNNITPTPASVLADFTLPTMTGYVQKAAAGWTPNEEPGDGSVSTAATNVVSWQGPGDGTGQTFYGYLLREAAGGALIAVVKFPVAIGLEAVTDVLDLVVSFQLP